MKINSIRVNGESYNVGGATAELYIENKIMYIKVPSGTVKSTDTPVFARYKRSRMGKRTRCVKKGWIEPLPSDNIKLSLSIDKTENGYDFVRISPTGFETWNDYLSETELTLQIFNNTCGVCIKRNGAIIVSYIPFRVGFNGDMNDGNNGIALK